MVFNSLQVDKERCTDYNLKLGKFDIELKCKFINMKVFYFQRSCLRKVEVNFLKIFFN